MTRRSFDIFHATRTKRRNPEAPCHSPVRRFLLRALTQGVSSDIGFSAAPEQPKFASERAAASGRCAKICIRSPLCGLPALRLGPVRAPRQGQPCESAMAVGGYGRKDVLHAREQGDEDHCRFCLEVLSGEQKRTKSKTPEGCSLRGFIRTWNPFVIWRGRRDLNSRPPT